MKLTETAREFALKKHQGQKRKFTGESYISHPFAVGDRVRNFCDDEEVISAAYLHDVLEDTTTTEQEIREVFGEKILSLVKELTSNKKDEQLIGKAQYLTNKINNMSDFARLIKFADREHNVSDLSKEFDSFSSRYAKETLYILNHLNFVPNQDELILIESIRKKIKPFI